MPSKTPGRDALVQEIPLPPLRLFGLLRRDPLPRAVVAVGPEALLVAVGRNDIGGHGILVAQLPVRRRGRRRRLIDYGPAAASTAAAAAAAAAASTVAASVDARARRRRCGWAAPSSTSLHSYPHCFHEGQCLSHFPQCSQTTRRGQGDATMLPSQLRSRGAAAAAAAGCSSSLSSSPASISHMLCSVRG